MDSRPGCMARLILSSTQKQLVPFAQLQEQGVGMPMLWEGLLQ